MSKADCISEGKSPFRNVGGVRSCPKNLMCCRSPYNEYPCQGMGGICMDENVCERAEGKVIRLTKNGRWGCPSQPSNILCCKKIKPAQNNCGLASGPESSIGKSAGKIADRSKWPWIADLTGVDMSLGCAGVLISSTTVLTAAHCVSHDGGNTPTADSIEVVLGRYNLSHSDSTEQRILVSSIKMKIFSAVTFETDLAILKLSRPATLNKFVNVLCLAEKEFLSGSSCYAAGWGQTLDRRERSPILREIFAPMWDWERCKTFLDQTESHTPFGSTMVCAGGTNDVPHLCTGDSGGPLMCQKDGRWYLQGIISWSPTSSCENNSDGHPDVFASTARAYKWILAHM